MNYPYRAIVITVALFFPIFLHAQLANIVFFAEQGEKFTIVMNGLRYNEEPSTHVRLTDLKPALYKVKVIFDNKTLGEVNKSIPLESGKEYTFNIRQQKPVFSGKKNKKGLKEGAVDTQEKYVMRFISEAPIAMNYQPVVPPTQPVYQQAPVVQAETVTQTTTVRGVQQPATGANVNVSVNNPDVGVNFNLNVGTPGTTVQQTTTTTTTYGNASQGTVHSQPNHYIMPGYNGPIGCPWPMEQNAYRSAISSISKQAFEENKLQVAKQVFMSNCMTSAQVTEILRLFNFEDSRLDFAKFAYGHTFDLGNYFMVNDAFTFSSSVDELNDYISAFGR